MHFQGAAFGRTAIVLSLGLGLLQPGALNAADKLKNYLALGDSVAFGLDVRLLDPSNPPTPSDFTGYPELIGFIEGLNGTKLLDASCPGESSGSFINVTAPDYGCNGSGPQGQPAFKTSIGLHVQYSGSQLQYALQQLSAKKPDLVTLGIGSNDILVALRNCGGDFNCLGGAIPTVLGQYAQNLGSILQQIRSKYNGTLVLVKYYAPTPEFNAVAVALNDTMAAVGANFHVKIADGYNAFRIVSAPFGGNPCTAGLLVPLGGGVCDIHPSKLGSTVLAATIEASR